MRIRISDPAFTASLVAYLRGRGYLAVEEKDGVTVVPINAMTETYDRVRLGRDVESWRKEHPDVEVEVDPE